MSFLSPASFFIFLPLAAVVVLLYLLKLKRKDMAVSSVMFWQNATADLQANAPLQKLKKSLLLLLQLLALLALAAALARPFIRIKGSADNKIAVIIDCSASMQAKDINPSRFDDAKTKAMALVNKLGYKDSMLVITAGAKTKVVQPFTTDKRALYNAISSIKPTDTRCNMREALTLALSLAGQSSAPPRIVIFSDGGFEPVSGIATKKIKLDFIKTGKRSENIAITGMDFRRNLSGDMQVFIETRNFGKNPRSFNLELYKNDQLIDVREETLNAGKSSQEILSGVNNSGGVIKAKLDIDDDLAVDNQASIFLKQQSKIKVLLVSKGNIFLQNALNLDPRIELTKSDIAPASLDYDLLVFDRISPPKSLPNAGYLLIDTQAAGGPGTLGGSLKNPAIIDWLHTHPVNTYINYAGINISDAKTIKPSNWGDVILETNGGPIAVAGASAGKRYVMLSFDLQKTDFPLRVGFPIFIANCVDYLILGGNNDTGTTIRTGQSVYIDTPPSINEITITQPDGTKEKLNVNHSQVLFDGTDNVGIYKAFAKGFESFYACNLSSASESDTSPKDIITIGDKKVASKGNTISTNQEYYWYLIFAVLCIITFEWYMYHVRG